MNLIETCKHREQLFQGALLHVFRDTVVLPDGEESTREWIDHPGAAAVVPLFDDGSTVLLRQFRYPSRREFLEVPAGKLDQPGEEPQQVASRELAEEAGIEAARYTSLGATYPCIGYSNEVIYLFLAEGLREIESGTEPDEFVVPVRLPLEEAVAMAHRGDILDAKSTVALVRAGHALAERRRQPPAAGG